MELVYENTVSYKTQIVDQRNSNEIIAFPVDNIDTAWMTRAQKIFFEILKEPANRSKHYKELLDMAGYKNDDTWHRTIRDERFSSLLINMGVTIRRVSKPYPAHNEVEFIRNPKERENYLQNDLWDMRKIFDEYPRQACASEFIVDFTKILNPSVRKIVKRYYASMLTRWKPVTFKWAMTKLVHFFNSMYELFPEMNSFKMLTRENHMENIMNSMTCSNETKKECLNLIRSMLKYMHDNKWEDAAKSDTLIIGYDVPKGNITLPRPIPPDIRIQLDNFIEEEIIHLLEQGNPTPIVDPEYWDTIIVVRHTGRRFEDIAHLISDDSDIDCLRYDMDGDPQLYIDHRIAKIPKELVIPLAHLKASSSYGNIVERAIKRQK